MNVKKRINKLIIIKINEIILIICFFITTTILNKKNNLNNINNFLHSDNLVFTNLIVEKPINYVMYPMEKSEALNRIVPAKLIIKNESLTSEEYNFLLKISKESSIDYHNLNISLNEKVAPLYSFYLKEDDKNYYFLIETNTLKSNNKEYLIKVWLDIKAKYNIEKNQLISSFEIVKSITKI